MVASFRKQLAAFQAQLTGMDKQIADLKNFIKGESSHANGLQMHKSYTMEPVQDPSFEARSEAQDFGSPNGLGLRRRSQARN